MSDAALEFTPLPGRPGDRAARIARWALALRVCTGGRKLGHMATALEIDRCAFERLYLGIDDTPPAMWRRVRELAAAKHGGGGMTLALAMIDAIDRDCAPDPVDYGTPDV